MRVSIPRPAAVRDREPVEPTSEELDAVAELIRTHAGLTFPPSRRTTLADAVRWTMAELGLPSVAALRRRWTEGDHATRERLLGHATIGETYFFRHSEQVRVLVERVLPSIIVARERDGSRRIRMWSAGCGAGQEAYTLAMLARHALGRRRGWDVRVVGTDIDAAAIEQAKSGVYRPWSFRTGESRWLHWFERDGSNRRVRREVADLVEFHVDNLVADALPPGLDEGADLIVCRNVTIYFDRDATGRVAARFHAALRPGGMLLVAPVETSGKVYAAFEPMVVDNVTLYRRPTEDLPPASAARAGRASERAATAPRPGTGAGHPRGVAGADRARAAGRRPRPASRMAPTAHDPLPAAPDSASADLVARARSLADGGRLPEARRLCEAAIARDPRLTAAHSLLATIAEAEDDLEAARAALGRAVYLDRSDPELQFRLGLVEWRTGRATAARRRLAAALALVERAEASGGHAPRDLTPDRLRAVVQMMVG